MGVLIFKVSIYFFTIQQRKDKSAWMRVNTKLKFFVLGLSKSVRIYVTLQAKTSLVHTSKFATSMLYNFCWERRTESKFAGIID